MDFSFFFSLFGTLIAFFYSLVPSYGFAIIALTLSVMIVLTPLTLKGTRSMMMMQQLQPEMKKLQSRYKDDRQKLNEELLKFYKENNINPVGGCLPLLVQMPVFLVLYNVLRGLTQRIPSTGSSVGWVTGQFGVNTPFTRPPLVLNNFDPEYVPHDTALYQNLSHTNSMAFAGMDLAESASTAISRGLGHAIPYILLIVVVGVSGFVQQRQIQGRTPNSQINPQQQQIMKIMPIFLPVISFTLPSGLVLYFAVSNLYRIGQQWFISRSIYGIKKGEKESTAALAKESGSSGKGGGSGKGGSTKAAKGVGPGPRPSKGGTTKELPAKGSDGDSSTNGSKSSNGAKQDGGGRSTKKVPSKAPSRDPNKRVAANDKSDGATASAGATADRGTTKKRADRATTSGPSASDGSSSGSADSTPSAASSRDGATRPPTLQPREKEEEVARGVG